MQLRMPAIIRPLRSRDFRRVWLGQLVSVLATACFLSHLPSRFWAPAMAQSASASCLPRMLPTLPSARSLAASQLTGSAGDAGCSDVGDGDYGYEGLIPAHASKVSCIDLGITLPLTTGSVTCIHLPATRIGCH